MDLTRLSYFVALADAGGFTRAARLLEIAQPTLSQQIRKLEREAGRPLIDRLPRGIVLTNHGKQLLEHARPLLRQAEQLRSRIRDQSEAPSGPLSVGVIPTVAPYLLPRLLKRFLQKCPQVTLTIHEDVTSSLMHQLEAGVLDLAIASSVDPPPTVHLETLFEEPLLAVLHHKHALAKKRRIDLMSLQDDRLLLLHDMHCLSRQVAELCFAKTSIRKVAMRGESLTTIGQLVDVGMGVSIVPQMMAAHDASPYRAYRPFEDDVTRPITLALPLLRYRTSAARAMVGMLKAIRSGST